MPFNVTKSHKVQLLELINRANNIFPPIRPEEVSFSQPQSGSWSNEGVDYNSIVEMSFLPGFRSDPGIEIPFFYNRTDASEIIENSVNTYPIFRDKGPGPFTSHSIIPYINTLYGLQLTADDVALTNGTAASTESYMGMEVHTSVLLDFTPSLRFSGSITAYFGAELQLSLENAYVGPYNLTGEMSTVVSDWIQLVNRTLAVDGYPTLGVASEDMIDLPSKYDQVVTSNIRIVTSDKTKVRMEIWSPVGMELSWRQIPAAVYLNGKRFIYQTNTAFTPDTNGVSVSTVTFTAEDALPIEANVNEYVFVYYGDEFLNSNPAAI